MQKQKTIGVSLETHELLRELAYRRRDTIKNMIESLVAEAANTYLNELKGGKNETPNDE